MRIINTPDGGNIDKAFDDAVKPEDKVLVVLKDVATMSGDTFKDALEDVIKSTPVDYEWLDENDSAVILKAPQDIDPELCADELKLVFEEKGFAPNDVKVVVKTKAEADALLFPEADLPIRAAQVVPA